MSCDVGQECAEVHRSEFRRARKEHGCVACGETVRRGDVYFYYFSIFEGEPQTLKYCLRCKAMYSVIAEALPDDQVPDPFLNCGHSWEELHGDCPPAVSRLAFLTRDEMQRELSPCK